MVRVERTVRIDAPPDKVWAVLTDVERWPEWTPSVLSVERTESGPFRLGSCARLGLRGAPMSVRPFWLTREAWQYAAWKRHAREAETWCVTEFEEGRSFTWGVTDRGVTTSAGPTVLPRGTGSRVTLTVVQSGWRATLFAPLTAMMLRRKVTREAEWLRRWCQIMDYCRMCGHSRGQHGEEDDSEIADVPPHRCRDLNGYGNPCDCRGFCLISPPEPPPPLYRRAETYVICAVLIFVLLVVAQNWSGLKAVGDIFSSDPTAAEVRERWNIPPSWYCKYDSFSTAFLLECDPSSTSFFQAYTGGRIDGNWCADSPRQGDIPAKFECYDSSTQTLTTDAGYADETNRQLTQAEAEVVLKNWLGHLSQLHD